jgi:hypothetical protein
MFRAGNISQKRELSGAGPWNNERRALFAGRTSDKKTTYRGPELLHLGRFFFHNNRLFVHLGHFTINTHILSQEIRQTGRWPGPGFRENTPEMSPDCIFYKRGDTIGSLLFNKNKD